MGSTVIEYWDAFDAEERPLGWLLKRGESVPEGVYHLVSQIWVRNAKGEFLVQKRAEHLKHMPGLWASTGGSALEGAARELKEEIGVEMSGEAFELVFKSRGNDAIFYNWLAEWEGYSEALEFQLEEVSEVKWVSKEWILSGVREGWFFDYGEDVFEKVGVLG
ncbi:MAG: NUDIX domain-containing protein [Verrucomicrobiota bacterium]